MTRRAALAIVSLVVASCGGDASVASSTSPPAPVPAAASACAGIDESRPRMHSAAQAGTIPSDVPTHLGAAIAAIPAEFFTALAYGGCTNELSGGLEFEQMAWTNGIGLMLISWQQWPDDGPMVALPLGGDSYQAGIVQVAVADVEANERTRAVHLYDGMRVVSVVTYALTTLSVDRVDELAWAIYDALPIAPAVDRTPTRGFQDLLEALPADGVSLGEPSDVEGVSPFTATMGIAAATREFIAAGSTLTAYDFGAIGAADRAAEAIASDGYTIARQPYDVAGTPRFWRWDRIVLEYMGDDPILLRRLVDLIGQPFAGTPVAVTDE